MKYIKIYEGFFEERKKLEDKFLNDLENIIPDVLNIEGISKSLILNNDVILFRLGFDKEQKISDISKVLSYDLKMMDNLLNNDYNITYMIHCWFGSGSSHSTAFSADNFFAKTNVKINEFINLFTEIESYKMKYIIISFNKKFNFKKSVR